MSENFSTQQAGRVMNINIEGNNFSLTVCKQLGSVFQGTLSNLTISNLLLVTIYQYINYSSEWITDLETIKTLLPNANFDSITKI